MTEGQHDTDVNASHGTDVPKLLTSSPSASGERTVSTLAAQEFKDISIKFETDTGDAPRTSI